MKILAETKQPSRSAVLNADLGEWESLEQAQAMLPYLRLTHVSCGVHAGTRDHIRAVMQASAAHGVSVGAHPGLSGGDGRNPTDGNRLSAQEFEELLSFQTQQLLKIADGIPVVSLKCHGTLYHACDQNLELRQLLVKWVLKNASDWTLVCGAGGATAALATESGCRVWEEIFADRAYQSDGQLVPRAVAGSVIATPELVADRLRRWKQTQTIQSLEGTVLHLPAHTVCVHGDTPNAPMLAMAVAQVLQEKS